MLKKLLFSCVLLASFSASASEKMYIDAADLCCKQDSFHIHTGHNVWIQTETIHRDSTGLYTFESSILKSINGHKNDYEKKWKCPYCHQYWPTGKACGNKDCPSKYKV